MTHDSDSTLISASRLNLGRKGTTESEPGVRKNTLGLAVTTMRHSPNIGPTRVEIFE